MKKYLSILLCFMFISCDVINEINSYSNLSDIIYVKDGIGVFIYKSSQNKSRKIIKLDKIYLDNSLKMINDTIVIIGYKGLIENQKKNKLTGRIIKYPCNKSDSIILENFDSKYTILSIYKKCFISINIKTNSYNQYKTIKYTHSNFDSLRVDTMQFDLKGKKSYKSDTSFQCSKITSSFKGIT